MPTFSSGVENQTVIAGRSAELKCSVKNLGNYKVSWVSYLILNEVLLIETQNYILFRISLYVLILGRLGSRGHTNHFNNTHQHNYKESKSIAIPTWQQTMEITFEKSSRSRQRMVHVSNKHGSNEKWKGLLEGCRYV